MDPKVLAIWILLGAEFSLQAQEWKLIWSDEFSGQGYPDSSKWSTETGFLRNEEKQYYTGDRPENVRLDGGHLVLECRREDYSALEQGRVRYTSGGVTTKNKASWQYGRFEIRARMPQGKGTWASLWLMGLADFQGKPWPEAGEIDIAEHLGREPEDIYGTLHFKKEQRHLQKQFRIGDLVPREDFYVYAIQWDPDTIRFFLDGEEYGSFEVSQAQDGVWNPFRKPFYLMISLALGGNWGGEIDESALPQQLRVDYVRIYQRENPAGQGGKPVWSMESSRSR